MTSYLPTAMANVDLIQVILQGSLFAQFIMALLAIFSIGSWTVIFQKLKNFRKIKQATYELNAAINQTKEWATLEKTILQSTSPLRELFKDTLRECNLLDENPIGFSTFSAKSKNDKILALERVLQRSSVVQMGHLESQMGILATVAAVSPFVGLLGTVWGIIEAFKNIALSGNANLASVAPSISEALVATALGLVAAIPALMAYNYFQGELKYWQNAFDDFALHILALIEPRI